MPRLTPTILRQANRISPHAATLLLACRDLPLALNELRWIREHVQLNPSSGSADHQVSKLCRLRGRGTPLQYVLGTQPFGRLDIKCRSGVLIPRPEPEAYTTHLANLIRGGLLADQTTKQQPASLSILDVCTGTGCIVLLLFSLLQSTFSSLRSHGIDISPKAVSLARENISHNIARSFMSAPSPGQTVSITQGDLFSADDISSLMANQHHHEQQQRPCDIMICNPPYISHDGFAHSTARSVRNYEPKLAQVPLPQEGYTASPDIVSTLAPASTDPSTPCNLAHHEDVFYVRLLDVGTILKPKVMLFEVGDMQQALRVANMAAHHSGLGPRMTNLEIWRDWPDASPGKDEMTTEALSGSGKTVSIRGSGHGRSVLIQCT